MNPADGELTTELTNGIVERVSSQVRRYLNEHIIVGVGNIVSCQEGIRGSFEKARNTLNMLVAEPKGEDNYIALLKSYIDNNYANKLSLGELAALVHMNPAYLSAVFKSKTGENITDYILAVRMREAARLLRETGLKAYVVAERTGFTSVRYFNEVFKGYYGVPPAKYRVGG